MLHNISKFFIIILLQGSREEGLRVDLAGKMLMSLKENDGENISVLMAREEKPSFILTYILAALYSTENGVFTTQPFYFWSLSEIRLRRCKVA